MKAVANMILANAPFAPGPRLLPLTMLAPVRRPMAAPITVITQAAVAAPDDAVITGSHGSTRRSQPSWLSAFLDRATEEKTTTENAVLTPSPDLPLRVPC